MAEQIRAAIRRSRGRRSRAGRGRVFATLGSFGRDAADPWSPAEPAGAVAARPAKDPVDTVTSAFGVLQGLFLLRVLLALASVGRAVPAAAVILALTDPLVEPFRIAAHVDPAPAAVPLLDVPALLALIVWTLVETVCLAAVCVHGRRRAGDPALQSGLRAGGWAGSLAKGR
jgi:uncharacterized protein YggT (Ycf19 family)